MPARVAKKRTIKQKKRNNDYRKIIAKKIKTEFYKNNYIII